MSNENVQVAVFDTLLRVTAAIRHIQESGFDTNRVSLAARDQRSNGRVTGYYCTAGRIKYRGELEALWNEIFAILSGWAFFAIPDIGPVLIAGPLADWFATALANAAIFGGLSAVGMGLYSVGISRDRIRFYEDALKDSRYLLLLNGPAGDVSRAKEIINGLE